MIYNFRIFKMKKRPNKHFIYDEDNVIRRYNTGRPYMCYRIYHYDFKYGWNEEIEL
jgi:hypothetical protein